MRNYSLWLLLPLLYSVCTAAGLWMVYFVGIRDERIKPLFSQNRSRRYAPYISILGNFPPASCIFSEVMNMAAFVGFIIGVLRYHQLRPVINKAWLNILCLVLFSLSCFGMTLVGNIQIFTQMVVHSVGAFGTFVLGTIYCWIQSGITIQVDLRNEGKKVGIVRFLLSGGITICLIAYGILMSQRNHMNAARVQWAMVMLFLTFLATFGVEFRHSRFDFVHTQTFGIPVREAETDGSTIRERGAAKVSNML
ncbi:transmembrane protein 150C [Echeneis naucrates]|nr:transmembrane protein 150C [Echeneis naucrates]XP_029372390.1 transmembrane protein 150C [Echeneis naucrates]